MHSQLLLILLFTKVQFKTLTSSPDHHVCRVTFNIGETQVDGGSHNSWIKGLNMPNSGLDVTKQETKVIK